MPVEICPRDHALDNQSTETQERVSSTPVHTCRCAGNGMYEHVGQNLEEIEFEMSACHAAMTGNLAKLERILDKHPEQLNGLSDTADGYSPLIYAARGGYLEVVRYLIKKGASVNQVTKGMGSTALHRAAFAGNKDVVKVLLDAGANPAIQDCDHLTALDKAQMMASESDDHRAVCELLLEAKTGRRKGLSHPNLGNGY